MFDSWNNVVDEFRKLNDYKSAFEMSEIMKKYIPVDFLQIEFNRYSNDNNIYTVYKDIKFNDYMTNEDLIILMIKTYEQVYILKTIYFPNIKDKYVNLILSLYMGINH